MFCHGLDCNLSCRGKRGVAIVLPQKFINFMKMLVKTPISTKGSVNDAASGRRAVIEIIIIVFSNEKRTFRGKKKEIKSTKVKLASKCTSCNENEQDES